MTPRRRRGPDTAPTPELLLSREQVAQVLGLRSMSIASAEARGKPLLPKITLSKTCVRYRQADLDKLLRDRTSDGPRPA